MTTIRNGADAAPASAARSAAKGSKAGDGRRRDDVGGIADGFTGTGAEWSTCRIGYPSHRRFVVLGSVAFVAMVVLTAWSVWVLVTRHAAAVDSREAVIVMAVCVLASMFYNASYSTNAVSIPHTVVPVIAAVALFSGDLPVAIPIILVGLMIFLTVWRKSLFTASIEALGVVLTAVSVPLAFRLVPVSLCRGGDASSGCYPLAISVGMRLLARQWLVPTVLSILVAMVLRFLIDLAIAGLLGYRLCAFIGECSLQRVGFLLLTDVGAASVLGFVMLYSLKIGQDWSSYGRTYVVCLLYAIALDQYFRIRRSVWTRLSLVCFTDIIGMLPLPRRNPEESVIRALRRRFGMFRCSAEPVIPRQREMHSYVSSRAIDFNGRRFHLVMERSIWHRSFLPSDQALLDSLGSVLEEVARVGREISAVQGESEMDALTGVHNYRSFIGFLRSMAERSGSADVAVMYIDVDQLRRINRRYGYTVGNEVLKTMANRLRSVMPSGSFLARIGDDEFGVILDESLSPDRTRNLVSTVLDEVGVPVRAGDQLVEVSISAGISDSGGGKSVADLLIESEQRLSVSAQSSGVESEDSGESGADALAAVGAVDDAIEHGITANLYVPVFDMTSGRMTALRVIGRLPDGQGGYVSGRFARLQAERLGKSGQLALNVLDRAIRDLDARRSVLGFIDHIQMIVSRDAASDVAVLSRLGELSREFPDMTIDCILDGNALTSLSSDGADYLRSLVELPNVGLVINVPDATARDMMMILQLRVSAVRMDRTLMPDDQTPHGRDLVSSMVDWAESGGISVIFSNLSVASQLDALVDAGRLQIEGPLLCNPLTIGELCIRVENMGRGCVELSSKSWTRREGRHAAASDPSSVADDDPKVEGRGLEE